MGRSTDECPRVRVRAGYVPPIKLRRLADYDADVTVIGEVFEESLASAEQFAAETGALLVHPFDQPLTMAGVGTVTAEFSEQVPDLDTILIAVGGGGLLAGALAALEGTAARAVAVEPSSARCLGAALEAGEPVDVAVSGPAVDSLGVRRVGQLAFDAAIAHQVQHIDVTDEAITAAQLSAWQELRIGLEAGGATALAALLSGAYQPQHNEMVGALGCGGNVDIAALLKAA